ncbi:cytochrome c biogenesis protein CcsA [bacterium SCSIO 12741]|nr:cytochrome c biogenesis protein CcsA [bacterium SCSIO 12741]
MEYPGEHLLPGQVGNFFVILSFCAALLATISYFFATTRSDAGWKAIGRKAFYLHTAGIFGIVGTLFYMLFQDMFEYHYVWYHSSSELPLRYIFSCFWEGQEGSFLLWAFWHAVLGVILTRTSKTWEAPVMAVISSTQAFLISMILGVYLFEYRLGSNPFTVLLREHPDFMFLPAFQNPNYTDLIDGRGLNPLLQNYWMTIHPPTLFLGFASTIVPFAYAIAGMWKQDFNSWIKPALPWTVFSIFILGLGILMGGAWAYEALSFGGFWAWDPVENASLVPWIIIVGAAHLMLIQQKKGGVLVTLFLLSTLSFVLVLYSSFLTRSGVLGESSVHAFTDLGMSGQLLVYLLFYFFLSAGLIIRNYRRFPRVNQDEALWSREFWMFTGSLVLLISSFQITFSTSKPVINKVFGTNMAPPVDAIDHYNAWQTPFILIILILIGFSQYLNYRKTPFKKYLNRTSVAGIISLLLGIGTGLLLEISDAFHLLLVVASWFAVVGNTDYWLRILKGKIRHAGASISHIGFGLMMLGIVISMGKQDKISANTSRYDVSQLDKEFNNRENILLMENDTLMMGDYWVRYGGKERDGVNILFEVEYFEKGENNRPGPYAFTLRPRVQTNPRMGNVPEPDTRHFLNKDIYTHVTWARLEDPIEGDYEEPKMVTLQIGDTAFARNAIVVLDSVARYTDTSLGLKPTDLSVAAHLSVWDFNTDHHHLSPVFVLRDSSYVIPIPDELEQIGMRVTFTKINPMENNFEIAIEEKKGMSRDFIVMQAIVFPYINILWIGSILMFLGTILAIYNRIRFQ